jgi:lipopolysaccharide export system permease protein
MSWRDLRAAVARARDGEQLGPKDEPIEYELDLQRRLAAPFAPALFGLIGLPIGMRRARGARAFGALWCAGIAFAYYGAQIFFESLAEQGWLSAAAARWIPVAAFAGLAAVLLMRARRGS